MKKKKELPVFIKRRFTENELDSEFYDALEFSKRMMRAQNPKNLERFISSTISLLMDGLHPILMDTLPENLQWYDAIFDALKDYYKDIIIDEYEYI